MGWGDKVVGWCTSQSWCFWTSGFNLGTAGILAANRWVCVNVDLGLTTPGGLLAPPTRLTTAAEEGTVSLEDDCFVGVAILGSLVRANFSCESPPCPIFSIFFLFTGILLQALNLVNPDLNDL